MKGYRTMPTLRNAFLAVLLLAVASVTAHGQQVVAGSTFYFDHAQADFDDTDHYELCIDGVTDATCVAIGVVLDAKTSTLNRYRFTLPASAPRGNHTFAVRAVGKLDVGASDGSNVLSLRVIGKPSPPVNFREGQP